MPCIDDSKSKARKSSFKCEMLANSVLLGVHIMDVIVGVST